MASALHNACSSGDADAVRAILDAAAPADLEVTDSFGVTPLIEAVRNGHADIVQALLDKGADATHASAQGLPESYTSDAAILALLRAKAYPYPAPPPGPYGFYAAAPDGGPGAIGNLPPPDIARFIPCRYFPACRYGASCMFAHPQQYYPPPPAPYVPPYDPINVQQYHPGYFPPPPFQPAPVHPISPSPSDVPVPVPVQPPFSPNSLPPAPFGPMSPTAYPHPGQTPVPMIIAPLPPPHHQVPPIYNPPSTAPSYVQPEGYPVKPTAPPQDAQSPGPQDASPPHVHPGRGPSGQRRGGRRSSFNGRRPPCLFFPAGRCKNGDDCPFPHVPPDANAPHHMPYFSARGPKPPRQPNGNGIVNFTDKMAGLSVRDDAPGHRNGFEGSSRPQSTDTNRPRYHGKNGYGQNGARAEKRPPPPPKQQRVPNADEFPVLAGANTPPARNSGLNGLSNGHAGPTAAQVLSAPAPARKEPFPKDSSTRGTSPDLKSAAAAAKAESIADVAPVTTTHDHPAPAKLPISFAAVAAPPEITLSA